MTDVKQFPILFLANQCVYSQQLMRHNAHELSKCPRIIVYDRKDKDQKRKRDALFYIHQYHVAQFPTLIFADGSRLTTARGIQSDLKDSMTVLAEQPRIPRLQDNQVSHRERTLGCNQQPPDDGRINLHDPNVKTSAFGAWPTLNPQQANETKTDPSSQMYASSREQPQQHDTSYTVDHPTTPNSHNGLQPLSYNAQNKWKTNQHGSEAIGTSSDVDTSAAGAGSATMMGATEAPTHDEEQESLGQWPTSRKVQGLTGNGNKTMDTHRFLTERASRNQNMQGAQMQLGQNVADPVPCYST